jgi:hypothetical protein
VLAYVAVTASAPVFWPLVLFAAIVPWLPLPGRAEWKPAMLLSLALLGTTIVTHAIFFGEDRYHIVVTPVLCMLAAGALRSPTLTRPLTRPRAPRSSRASTTNP